MLAGPGLAVRGQYDVVGSRRHGARCCFQAHRVSGREERAQRLACVDAVIVGVSKALHNVARLTVVVFVLIVQARHATQTNVKPIGAIADVAVP